MEENSLTGIKIICSFTQQLFFQKSQQMSSWETLEKQLQHYLLDPIPKDVTQKGIKKKVDDLSVEYRASQVAQR